ncbi:hypothetical protein KCP76_19685 [Salmonella enterica subsp. enterica serovar Weltevreden]|nr:hypothetical protein KCP76_19685 [Salmonella enterica subsp. enterica serovar Weltevreden]
MKIDNSICETPYGAWRWADGQLSVLRLRRERRAAAIIYSLLGTCKLNDVESRHGYATCCGKSATGHRTAHELPPLEPRNRKIILTLRPKRDATEL